MIAAGRRYVEFATRHLEVENYKHSNHDLTRRVSILQQVSSISEVTLALALNPLRVWLPKSVVNSISLRRPQRAWGGRAGLGIEKRTNTVERHNGDRHPKAGRALGQGSSDPSWVHAGCRATSPAGKGQGQLASAGPEPPNSLLPLPQGKDDQSLGRGLYTD